MNRQISFLLLLFVLCACKIQAQEVKNVTAEQKGKKIIIQYTLSGKAYQIFNVSLFVSRDDGRTFIGPMKEVSGDVGDSISRGIHTIEWYIIREMPLKSEALIFDVRAEVTGSKPIRTKSKVEKSKPSKSNIPEIKNSFFISYVGNTTTYIGLRAGMLGRIGFYGEVRGNVSAFRSAKYTYKDGALDYALPGYYVFTGVDGYSAFSALAGIIYQPVKNFFLNLGGGYGKEDYLMQLNEYSYDDVETGTAFAKYEGYCNSGVEVNLGAMYKIKKILISVSVTSINFKTVGWTAGLGLSF